MKMKVSIKHILLTLLCIVLFISFTPIVTEANSTYHWKLYTDAQQKYKKKKYDAVIPLMKEALKQNQSVAYYRLLAESYEQLEQYQNAANTFYDEAKVQHALALKSGDYNTYYAVLARADKLNTELELYIEDKIPLQSNVALSKFEPAQGLYIGAYIEKDSHLEAKKSEKYRAFNELTAKQHGIYFTYHKYGQPFPKVLAANVKAVGGAIQLALEPKTLADIKNDEYLKQFAKDAQDAGTPIFLRFASEMNGSWVNWNGNPKLYIEKFRLIHDVMEQYAPNVAMLWSPAANPKQTINDYYPGDKYVDWVGLSMYSVKYFNGDVKTPADHVNPLDLLDYVYEQYADRKPIMVSEYGATHFSKAGNTDTTTFAITKMNMLYSGVKLKYPRVKAINWFSLDTLVNSHSTDRMLNNFSLTDNVSLLASYSKLIKDPYYLSAVVGLEQVSPVIKQSVVPYKKQTIHGDVKGIIWTKSYDPYISKVIVDIDGQEAKVLKQYPYEFNIEGSKLKKGKHSVKISVYDSKGKVATNKTYSIHIDDSVGELQADQIRMYLNESYVYTKQGKIELPVAPFTAESTTLVPLRFISTMLGAEVKWDNTTKKVTINGTKKIILTLESKMVEVDGRKMELMIAPREVNGNTFVPLRFVNEQLGGKIAYSKENNRIDIFKQ